jgi:hypothetical protein
VPVAKGTKVIEIDPRGADAVFPGIGERLARVADAVLRALRGPRSGHVVMIDRVACDTNRVVNVLNAAALANVNRAKQ